MMSIALCTIHLLAAGVFPFYSVKNIPFMNGGGDRIKY